MSTTVTAAMPLQDVPGKKITSRVDSIDLLRGLIMIIMALDHVRDYFHADAYIHDPTDLSHTSTILFFTRWITHFCAPTFMFLSGTSAFLVGIRKGKKALSKFLLTRGLWLIFLELTVINFGWYFNIEFPSIDFLVIWALGISMIFLSLLVYLPIWAILIISLVMIFGHNLLDTVHVQGEGAAPVLWSVLHQQNLFFFGHFTLFIGYPIIPWIGVMSLGYCLGRIYAQDITPAQRKKILLWLGTGAILLFITIRYINGYGDPFHWSKQQTARFTFLSFLNVSKYPPSLLYILVTLGPGLLFLAITENKRFFLSEPIKVIGRVPMFYYLVHIYLVHLVALFSTYFIGYHPRDMVLSAWVNFNPHLQGFGFSLGVVYAVWLGCIVILYFLCKWYDRYKRSHHYWWLSYL
jgi:uncharacterized membrane protein